MTIFKRLLLLFPLALLLVPSVAQADEAAPQWTVSSVSRPTNFAPGGNTEGDEYVILVTNTGGAPNTEVVGEGDGAKTVTLPVTITDELPAGLTAETPGATSRIVARPAARGASVARMAVSCSPVIR